jgi:urease accessory protein UreF
MADDFQEVPIDAAAQSAPVLELLQATHDRMYSKLFQS